MKSAWMRLTIVAIAVGIFVVTIHLVTSPPAVSAMRAPAAQRAAGGSVVVACPGRVEGRADTISVGAAADGVVQAIYVREGQKVSEGARLAEIACQDLASALSVARAEAESVKQARARLLRGSRQEEREAAAQRTAGAKAVVDQTSAELNRATQLSQASAISQAAYDQSKRNFDVAEASLKEALRNEELINAGPTAEDLAKADADVSAADERVKLAEEKIGKCVVRAPAAGTVLRVNLREGESFSTVAPHPLFTIADLSGRRVRAEVDERDIGKVQAGQQAFVSSDAYPGRHFSGTVARTASIMGRKSVVTGDPADKSDRDILEAIVDLGSDAADLPMGLRVTVQFVR